MSQELINHLRTVDNFTLIGEVIKQFVTEKPKQLIKMLKTEMEEDEKVLETVIGAKGIELLRKATV